MKASLLLDLCLENGIDFFTGVPDSQLKGLCDELYARFGVSGKNHLVAHNEGGAIGLCAGHYLSTGRPACCYMQNSGLGNAVNPLASLMDTKVYGLPCLLVIGWRGEPGVHDEPQHVRQGEITTGQLDLLEIPWEVLSPSDTEEEFPPRFGRLLAALSQGKCAALVVRKGALKSDARPDYANAFEMTREAVAEYILDATDPRDVLVSTTGKLSREIFEIRERRGQDHSRDFLTVGSMGHASMIALGIARNIPDRRVWCLDGDGALLMHLGAMEIIARSAPENLVHVVFNNQAHETVGGMPVCEGRMDIPALARAAGYRNVLSAAGPEALRDALSGLKALPGPTLLQVCCACGARADLGRPTTTPPENRDALMRFLRS